MSIKSENKKSVKAEYQALTKAKLEQKDRENKKESDLENRRREAFQWLWDSIVFWDSDASETISDKRLCSSMLSVLPDSEYINFAKSCLLEDLEDEMNLTFTDKNDPIFLSKIEGIDLVAKGRSLYKEISEEDPTWATEPFNWNKYGHPDLTPNFWFKH